jgi:hypothetical protein
MSRAQSIRRACGDGIKRFREVDRRRRSFIPGVSLSKVAELPCLPPGGRSQSRRCAINRPRWFSGTSYSLIAFLIAACSSGAS